jgi:lysyl-tRNA synthetase class 2
LEIGFLGGGIYQYFKVPASVHTALMNAPSKGQYFDVHIKKAGYLYRQVG